MSEAVPRDEHSTSTPPAAASSGAASATAGAVRHRQGGARRWLGRLGLVLLGVVVLAGGGGGAYAYSLVSAYEASMARHYDLPLPEIHASTEPAVIERGRHLSFSIAGCSLADCHGKDLGGGKAMDMGPIGVFAAPNITPGGIASAYTDPELARLIRHGVRKNGVGVRLMPVVDWSWLPDDDVRTLVSYVRSMPTVDRATQAMTVGPFGKVLDRYDSIPIDIARRVDHEAKDVVPAPAPTAAYGRFVMRLCTGCHGSGLSGGPIPGTPPDFPVPANITRDATGIAGWTYEDFVKTVTTRVSKRGKRLADFMPTEAIVAMNETERRALWEALAAAPPRPFGNR